MVVAARIARVGGSRLVGARRFGAVWAALAASMALVVVGCSTEPPPTDVPSAINWQTTVRPIGLSPGQSSAGSSTSSEVKEWADRTMTLMATLSDHVGFVADRIRAHDYPAARKGCTALGDAGRSFAADLPAPQPKVTALLRHGVDDIAAGERQCLALTASSQPGAFDTFIHTMEAAAGDLKASAGAWGK